MATSPNPPRKRTESNSKPAPSLITVGDKIVERPNPKNIPAMFQGALENLFSVDEVESMYRGLMSADRIYRDRNGKEVRCPDHHTRLAALKDYMDRVVGRPIERQQVIHSNAPASLEDLMTKAKKSPVFNASLRELLERLKVEGA